MKKFSFYIATAFFCFSIGVAYYYQIFCQTALTQTVVEQNHQSDVRSSLYSSCNNEKLLIVWNEMDETDRAEESCNNLLEIEEVDLNSDGESEYLIFGKENKFCSSGGCQFWVTKDNKIIFKTYGSFTIKPHESNGFKELFSSFRVYTGGNEITIYRFNGIKYVAAKCFSEEWSEIDKTGKITELKVPKTVNHKCTKDISVL